MQQFKDSVSERLSWWSDLGYGEILSPVTHRATKILILLYFHLMLAMAILGPLLGNYRLGLMGWMLSGFYFLWNILLDGYGGSISQKIAAKIAACEGRSAEEPDEVNVQTAFWGRYIRLLVALVGTIILSVVSFLV